MENTPRQREYIDSVDGAAHQSAVRIIGELETELAEAGKKPESCTKKCPVCKDSDHHWLEVCDDKGIPIYKCKHCEATKPYEPEPGELDNIIKALTNGVYEKPYCRRVDGQMTVFVADDQEFCRIAFIDDYAGEIANAICEAGLILKNQQDIIDRLKAENEELKEKLGAEGFRFREQKQINTELRAELKAKDKEIAKLKELLSKNNECVHYPKAIEQALKETKGESKDKTVELTIKPMENQC